MARWCLGQDDAQVKVIAGRPCKPPFRVCALALAIVLVTSGEAHAMDLAQFPVPGAPTITTAVVPAPDGGAWFALPEQNAVATAASATARRASKAFAPARWAVLASPVTEQRGTA
jgi:hypothetical protein